MEEKKDQIEATSGQLKDFVLSKLATIDYAKGLVSALESRLARWLILLVFGFIAFVWYFHNDTKQALREARQEAKQALREAKQERQELKELIIRMHDSNPRPSVSSR